MLSVAKGYTFFLIVAHLKRFVNTVFSENSVAANRYSEKDK